MSEDASRCYGDCSSALFSDQLQKDLVGRLEIQQQTSTSTVFHQFVANAQSDVSYYLLKPVSVTIYVLVTTTDNYLESLLTLTTLASSLECSTLTHINCLLRLLLLTFIVCIVCVAICQLFKRIYIHTCYHLFSFANRPVYWQKYSLLLEIFLFLTRQPAVWAIYTNAQRLGNSNVPTLWTTCMVWYGMVWYSKCQFI